MCRNKNKLVILNEITNISLPDNSADAIICIAVIHHLSTNELRLKALLEIKRLIKPKCKILISVWSINQPPKTKITFEKYGDNFIKWNHKQIRYYYLYKINEIKLLFIQAGLNIESHDYDCGNEIFTLYKN